MPTLNTLRGQTFSAKTPLEAIDLGMGFYPLIKGSTIASAVVEIAVESGTDPAPQALAAGEPVIKGGTIFQRVAGGQPNTVYRLSFQATTGAGEVFEEVVYLPVLSA